jgi:DNA repair protein SbcD/Mre11
VEHKFRFIHAADIHLDSPLRGLSNYEGCPADELRAATRQALERLVDLAIAENVDFVVIAGDIYDGDWQDYNTGLFFCRQLSRLDREDIPVYLISGNHDAESRMTKALKLPKGVHQFSVRQCETVKIESLGVALHGQGFATKAVRENLASNYPEAIPDFYNIGILHTSVGGNYETHQNYAPCSLGDMQAKGYDYWALGHIHTREVLCEDPLIVFPGNIQGRHIRETGPKGCEVVTVGEDGRATTEQYLLDVVRWAHVSIDAAEDNDADAVCASFSDLVVEQMSAAEERMLALRVTVSGRCPANEQFRADPEHWMNELRAAATDAGGGNVWIEKVHFDTSTPRDLDALAKTDGPVGHLLRFMDEIPGDDIQLAALAESLSTLKQKLPKAVSTGDDPLDMADQEWLKQLVLSIRGDLAHRLLETGEGV